jgi:Predicted metal-binding integral membrane protein (DUF2182)
MMAAMMLPSTVPMVVLFDRDSAERARRGQAHVPTSIFVLAYLLRWGGLRARRLRPLPDRRAEPSGGFHQPAAPAEPPPRTASPKAAPARSASRLTPGGQPAEWLRRKLSTRLRTRPGPAMSATPCLPPGTTATDLSVTGVASNIVFASVA